MTVAAYDAYCDATHPSDECPMCGVECRCDGPHESIGSALVTAAKSASSLRTLTPALGRSDEADTHVCDEEAEGRAYLFWFAWRSMWREIAQAYSRDVTSAKIGRRRSNPYHGAREATWAANHGVKESK